MQAHPRAGASARTGGDEDAPGGSAVVGSSRSGTGSEGRAVGEGVVWYRVYGVSRHLPASKGRGCPGEPGSVMPLPLLFHTCLYPLLRAAPFSRLSPCLGGAVGCGRGGRCECACLSATVTWDPSRLFLLTTKASAKKNLRCPISSSLSHLGGAGVEGAAGAGARCGAVRACNRVFGVMLCVPSFVRE